MTFPHSSIVAIAGLALAGTMAIVCFSKASGIMFLGAARTDKVEKIDKDVDIIMLLPMIILAFATFFIGLFPQYTIGFALTPVSMFVKGIQVTEILQSIVAYVQNLSWIFFIFLLVLIVVFVLRRLINSKYQQHTTWDKEKSSK